MNTKSTKLTFKSHQKKPDNQNINKIDLTRRRRGERLLPAQITCSIHFYPEEDKIKVEDSQMTTFNLRYDQNEKYQGDNKREIKMKPLFSLANNVESYTAAIEQLETEVFTTGFRSKLKSKYLQSMFKDEALCIFNNIIIPAKQEVVKHLQAKINTIENILKPYNVLTNDDKELDEDQKTTIQTYKAEKEKYLQELQFFNNLDRHLTIPEGVQVSDSTNNYFYKELLRQLQPKVFLKPSLALQEQKNYMLTQLCKITSWTAVQNAERLRTINSRMAYFPVHGIVQPFSMMELKQVFYNLMPDPWQGQIQISNFDWTVDSFTFEELVDYATRIEQNENKIKTKDQTKKANQRKNTVNTANKIPRSDRQSTSKKNKYCSFCKNNNNKFYNNHNTEDCGIKKRIEGTKNDKNKPNDMFYVSRQELEEREMKLKTEIFRTLKRKKPDDENLENSDSE